MRVFGVIGGWFVHHKVVAASTTIAAILGVVTLAVALWPAAETAATTTNNISNVINNNYVTPPSIPGMDNQVGSCPVTNKRSDNEVYVTLLTSVTDGCWSNELDVAKTPNAIRMMISYKNTSDKVQRNVVMRVNMAPTLELIPNTTKFKSSNHPDGIDIASNAVDSNGLAMGSYEPGAAGYLLFEVATPRVDILDCGTTQFRTVGVAKPEGMNEYYNVVNLNITRRC